MNSRTSAVPPQVRSCAHISGKNDVCRGLDESIAIGAAHDGTFENGFVLDEHVLDLSWTDPDPPNLQHVVRSARVPQKPVLVLTVLISVLIHRPSIVILVLSRWFQYPAQIESPQIIKFPDLAARDRLPFVIDDFGLIAWNGESLESRTDVSRSIGHKDMKNLR